jgi:hypothetical protein
MYGLETIVSLNNKNARAAEILAKHNPQDAATKAFIEKYQVKPAEEVKAAS